MSNLRNSVRLMGFLGNDPEIKTIGEKKKMARVSIATNDSYKNDKGEKIEETQWHRVQFFDKLAEIVGEYVRKGSQIYVEGRLKYGKYTDKDGTEKHTCDIVADSMQLLGSREQRQDTNQEPRRPAPQKPTAKTTGGSGFEDMDDDLIPF